METKTIHQEIEFDASPHDIYELIMDSEKHAAFSGAPAEISKEVEGKFSCYGDYINGENVELIQDKKIIQIWQGKDFPKGHFSKVTFDFEEKDGKTLLHFTHEDVPAQLAEHIEKGWTDHYWDKMKSYLSSR
jgi:activator of HSP90 ATPase